jgi:hypothetical protein
MTFLLLLTIYGYENRSKYIISLIYYMQSPQILMRLHLWAQHRLIFYHWQSVDLYFPATISALAFNKKPGSCSSFIFMYLWSTNKFQFTLLHEISTVEELSYIFFRLLTKYTWQAQISCSNRFRCVGTYR